MAGVAASPETAPPVTLEPSFRFFGRDETTLYVSYIPYLVMLLLHSLFGNIVATFLIW